MLIVVSTPYDLGKSIKKSTAFKIKRIHNTEIYGGGD